MKPQLGVCYYPEHWPESRWAADAAAMAAMGLAKVRIGEFAWSRIEPEPGRFDWAWLDRAIATLYSAGLGVILGTPSATPPKWLVERLPDMLAVGPDGQARRFGSRRHYCFSHAGYRAEACRIAEAMAYRYGTHPGVVAWQIDNEYGCHDTAVSYSAAAQRGFRAWLAQRYGDVGALNEAWGTVFWSQVYRSFDEVDAPLQTVTEPHPAHVLDYQRFCSSEVRAFNRAQCERIRPHSPGRPLMHNAMLFFAQFDHRELAQDLDVIGWDSYPLGALENFWFSDAEKARWLRSGHPDFAAFHHDLYRGMSRQPFWVAEQQPGPVNWGRWNPAPAPGMVRLWTWEAIAHGAALVSFFRWRQAPFAQEQMHAGLLTPTGESAPGHAEAAQVAAELAALPELPAHDGAARVALMLDYDCLWMVQNQPQGQSENPLRLVFEAYSALRQLGLDVNVVGRDAALDGYALVVLPLQTTLDEGLVARLQGCGAEVCVYPRGGSKTGHAGIPAGGAPGALQQALAVQVLRVESLRPGIQHRLRREAGPDWLAGEWRETLRPGPDTRVKARFADTGEPALVARGRLEYLATRLSPEAQRQWLAEAAQRAGLQPVELPPDLRLSRRGGWLFCFNYGDAAARLDVPQAEWLLGGPQLPPHGLAVARRR